MDLRYVEEVRYKVDSDGFRHGLMVTFMGKVMNIQVHTV
jgi:hypothetical protein